MQLKSPALILGVALFGMLLAISVIAAEQTKNDSVVKDGMLVSLQFTLFSEDGKTIQTNKGKDPLKYVQGQHMMIPGLEKELAGMKVGQEKHVKIKPEDAYGSVDPKAVQEVPKDQIPPEAQKVGAVLSGRNPQGMPITATVKEVKDKTVVVDLNHPMAGKTLVFDVKVLDIQPSPPPAPSSAGQPPQPGPAAKPAQPATPAPPK